MINEFSHTAADVVVVQRMIAAPPERVFSAWTDPGLLAQWWGPAGSEVVLVEMDVRVNGRYRIGIQFPGRDVYHVYGVYAEVDRPGKLAFTWRWERPEMDIGESLVTVELFPHEKRTHLVLTHARLPDGDARAAHREGWDSILDSLLVFVESPGTPNVPGN